MIPDDERANKMKIQITRHVRGYGIDDDPREVIEFLLQDCNELLANQWDNIPKHRQRKLCRILEMTPDSIQDEKDVGCRLPFLDDDQLLELCEYFKEYI